MESLESLRQLFEYDDWANRRSLQSISTAGPATDRALKFAGHVIGAQRVWLGRLEAPGSPPPAPWPQMSLEELNSALGKMRERWATFLGNLSPSRLDEDLVHRNSKGTEFRVPVRDVLMQLVMHSAYHRGQIAAAVREGGGTPTATDYIVYVRQRLKNEA